MATIRDATPEDAEALAELWTRYLREHYAMEHGPSTDVVLGDAIGPTRRVRFVVALGADGRLQGAAAWNFGYDLHHFVRGVDLLDLYVAPAHRGRGLAVQLMAHIAREGVRGDAEYMRGSASIEPTPGRGLYDRFVVYFDAAARARRAPPSSVARCFARSPPPATSSAA